MTQDVDTDRRLGSRDHIEVAIRWNILEPTRRRRWAATKPNGNDAGAVSSQATVFDLSVSGAAVRADTSPELQIGTPVVLELAGCRGTVVICRTQPARDPAQTIYGVAFVDISPELRDQVWALLGVVPS